MNKILRLAALVAVIGTAVLSYSLPQGKTASMHASQFPYPILPQNSK